MRKSITGMLLAMLMLLSFAVTPAFAAQNPTVTVDYKTGRTAITVKGEAGEPVGLKVEQDGKRYLLDSAFLDDSGTYTFTTTLPLNMKFDAVVNVAGRVLPIIIDTENHNGGGSGGNGTKTIRLSIDMKTINKGTILTETSVELADGDTVWSVLKRELDSRNIPYTFENRSQYQSVYIQSIDGVGEFDYGQGSGWMYSVNGKFPDYGCDQYQLSGGEIIQWRYTTNYGKDLGKDYNGSSGGSGSSSGGNKGGVVVIPPAPPAGTDKDSQKEPYSDVANTDWFADAVNYAVEKKLMQGTGEGKFAPNDQMTRAMLVTVLYRYEGEPETAETTAFADVADGQWFSDAVAWASELGIVNGYGDGTFGADDAITREQLVMILYHFAEKKDLDLSQTAALDEFDDAGLISGWALVPMRWAKANGMINGRSETQLAPQGTATRAEVATMLMRYLDGVMKPME